MAGDWIKVEKATARKREILMVASALKIHPDHAFGLCLRFWCWVDDNLTDCNARGVTKEDIDALLDRNGFADALVHCGWLQVREGSLVIPNMDRHLSQGAKTRALTKDRVNKIRNASSVTGSLPENRREDKSKEGNPLTPLQGEVLPFGSIEFRLAWESWKRHRTQIRKPLKPEMIVAQFAEFEGWGELRAIAAIKHTITMGWQGLREPEYPASTKPKFEMTTQKQHEEGFFSPALLNKIKQK